LEELKNREKQESEEGTNIGTLLIDNDFKVVKNVTYRVEEVIENFS
jgi:hypothetical protein